MEPAFIAICAALILQFFAAFLAVRLIIFRKRIWLGTVMLVMTLLMVGRRFLSLYRCFENGEGGINTPAEVIWFVLSLLLVIGFLSISRRLEPLAPGLERTLR